MSDSVELQQKLGIFCLYDDVEIPSLATRKSACFDLKAYLKSHTKVIAYNQYNHKKEILIKKESQGTGGTVRVINLKKVYLTFSRLSTVTFYAFLTFL